MYVRVHRALNTYDPRCRCTATEASWRHADPLKASSFRQPSLGLLSSEFFLVVPAARLGSRCICSVSEINSFLARNRTDDLIALGPHSHFLLSFNLVGLVQPFITIIELYCGFKGSITIGFVQLKTLLKLSEKEVVLTNYMLPIHQIC